MKKIIVAINSTGDSATQIRIYKESKKQEFNFTSLDVLLCVDLALKKTKNTPQDVFEWVTVQGLGRFSRTREALTIINTFAALGNCIAHSIDINAWNEDNVLEQIKTTGKIKSKFAIPIYSNPPRITMPKKK